MPAGGANDKQSKINFSTSSHSDNQRSAQVNNGANNITDANTGGNTNSGRVKRNRTQFEQTETSDHHLRVPDINGSGSDSSLFDSDSNITVVNNGNHDGNPIESPSRLHLTDNSVDRGTDERHKARIIRLERLRDKQDRYSSHIGFLKE